MVAHTFSPSAQEAEAGEPLDLRTAWSTDQVPGQPELCRETLPKTGRQRDTETDRYRLIDRWMNG